MPDALLDGIGADGSRWEEAIGSESLRTSLLVVDDDGAVCGFCVLGPDRDGDRAAGEIVAIYLRPDVWGHGYGWALMEAAVAELRHHGFGRAVLWVLSGNRRARRFYEGAGWTADDAETVEVWRGHPLPHVRYSRAL